MKLSQNDLIWYGRNFTKDNVTYFDYSASGFEFCFTGTKAQMTILSDSANWNEENKGVLGIYGEGVLTIPFSFSYYALSLRKTSYIFINVWQYIYLQSSSL